MTTNKKHKNLNSAVDKNILISMFKKADQQRDIQHWANSDEGRETLKKEAHLKDIRENMRVGQLVWKQVLFEDIDTNLVLSICSRIVDIGDDNIQAEMLYVTNPRSPGVKFYSCTDWDGVDYRKGDIFHFEPHKLEKKVSKGSGNVWWQVK